jgi:hypothetical protein
LNTAADEALVNDATKLRLDELAIAEATASQPSNAVLSCHPE